MGSDGESEDDLIDVRLDWPGEAGEFERPEGAAVGVSPSDSAVDAEAPDEPEISQELVEEQRAKPDRSSRSPLLPALLGRVETVRSTLETLSMRVDALGASTAGFHSAFSDSLTEYADTIARITRAQNEALEKYRRGNDRSVTELRRAIADGDEILRRVASRVDEVVRDIAALRDATHELVDASPSSASPGDASRRPAGADTAIRKEIAALRDDIVQLKRRLGVRAKAPAVFDDAQIDDLLERLKAQIGPARLSDDAIERVAEAVAMRLGDYLELVPDDTVAPPPVPAADKRPAANKAASSRRRGG